MIDFLLTLAGRNAPLYYFGWGCWAGAGGCLLLTRLSATQVQGVSAWYKPFKFCASLAVLAWTMGWYLAYLGPQPAVTAYTWALVATLGFEAGYIALQAARGQLSHFNTSTPFHTVMFALMGLAIVAATGWTAYIAVLFWQAPLPALPAAYAWGIRLGLLLFVVFALEGGLMAQRLSHTVGGPDGSPGLPLLNWSRQHGDLRVAHFVGMHALQVLPLLAYYVAPSVPLIMLAGLLYGVLAVALCWAALRGKPVWPHALRIG